jgi:hypothetical protein
MSTNMKQELAEMANASRAPRQQERQRASDATSYFFAVRPAHALDCQFADDGPAAGSGDRTEDLKAALVIRRVTQAPFPSATERSAMHGNSPVRLRLVTRQNDSSLFVVSRDLERGGFAAADLLPPGARHGTLGGAGPGS